MQREYLFCVFHLEVNFTFFSNTNPSSLARWLVCSLVLIHYYFTPFAVPLDALIAKTNTTSAPGIATTMALDGPLNASTTSPQKKPPLAQGLTQQTL